MESALDQLRTRVSLPDKGFYLAGLSGGADSVALLQLLLPGIREGAVRIRAVHVNHGLRGSEADEDERFAGELCRASGIGFTAFRADLGGRKDEASARAARYSFFRRAVAETGADGLLLAHNADDQAETFLMRLLRGAGADGLQCMADEQERDGIRILRPMLALGREEIRKALLADGIKWREDSSNRDTAYLRNRIRMELIPLMEEMTPGAVRRICEAARLIRNDNEALQEAAREKYTTAAKDGLLETDGLETEPEAVQSRALRMWWRANGPALDERELSSAQIRQLIRLLRSEKGTVNLPGGYHAGRSPGFLCLTGPVRETPAPVEVSGPETCFQGFRLTETPSEGNPGDGKRTQEVPAGFTAGCQIRTRRPGDRIRPFGSNGSRKLQDYLTDRKIPEVFRDRIPLLCKGQEVLLVCGVGAGGIPRWDRKNHPVRLTWHGEIPWQKERNRNGTKRKDLPRSGTDPCNEG